MIKRYFVVDSENGMDKLQDVNNSTRRVMLGLMTLAVMITVMGLAIVVYWSNEPDPLQVAYVDGDQHWSKCQDRSFSFKRLVSSNKHLTITVQERWHDLNGFMDYKNTEGEYVYGGTVTYTLGAGFEKVMIFNKKVPTDIPVGLYEYRPWAAYRVNPIKTITKLLPVQNVNVVCDYDPVKHGA